MATDKKKPVKKPVKKTTVKPAAQIPPVAKNPSDYTGPDVPKVSKAVEGEKVPKGYIIAEEGTYIAKKRCYFGITLYHVGRPLETAGGELIPHHFEKKKK